MDDNADATVDAIGPEAASAATPAEHGDPATHSNGAASSAEIAVHAFVATQSIPSASSHVQPPHRSRSRTPSPPPPTVMSTVSLVVQPATPSVGSIQLPLPPPIAPAKAAEARLHSPQPPAAAAAEADDDADDASDNSDTDSAASDEGEEPDLEIAGSSKQPAPFVPLLPRPLLFCLTLVGCTFVFASLLLLFGVRSWGIREERVSLYNRAVDEWSTPGGFSTQMARARFGLVDMRKHAASDEDPGAALEPATRFGNDTWLVPVQQQTAQEGQVESTSAAADDDETASDVAAAAAASAAAPVTRNINGLRDLGSDVRSYAPFFHELLLPSPISWDSSARDLAPDRYWSRLLTHDSRTLYLDTLLDGRRNSIFNLTIPFLKRETLSEHLTKHSCESNLSGMWDRRNRRCTFFAQLHAVCLRVRLLDMPAATHDPAAAADPSASEAPTQMWSLDAKDVGFGIVPPSEGATAADQAEQTEPLTSLFISPPSAARLASSNETVFDASGVSGCIWNEIARDWTVGEYHAVDIRSEHEMDDGDALDLEAGDAEARAAIRKRLELESLLRLTLKSAHDPFLLAQSLTEGILWFGLAKTEKILLSVVLGSVGALFLLAPTFVVATQYGWIHRKKYKGSRRARKGGYTSVVAPDATSLASVVAGGASKANKPKQSKARKGSASSSSPASPSHDALMSADADADDDDAPHSSSSIELSPYSGNGAADRSTEGFVPSEALRQSLVASPGVSEPSASPVSHGADSPSSSAAPGSSPPSRKSIRIDPTPHYFPPRHSPPSPSRSTPRRGGLLSKKGLEATARARALFPAPVSVHRAAAAVVSRPKAGRSLTKVLRGNFSFTNLLAAWSGSNGARGKAGKQMEDDDDDEEEEQEEEEDEESKQPEPIAPTPAMEIGRALSLAALQEQKRNASAATISSLADLGSPISPIPAPATTTADSTLTPWSSPRE